MVVKLATYRLRTKVAKGWLSSRPVSRPYPRISMSRDRPLPVRRSRTNPVVAVLLDEAVISHGSSGPITLTCCGRFHGSS